MTLDICRICGTTEDLKHIFSEGNDELVEQIRLCANIQIDVNDCLPKYVCKECETGLAFSFRLRQRSEQTEKRLRQDLITIMEPLSLGDESIIDSEDNNLIKELGEEEMWVKDESTSNFNEHECLIEEAYHSNEDISNGLPEDQLDNESAEPWICEDNDIETGVIPRNSVIEEDLVEFIEISIARDDLNTEKLEETPICNPKTKQFECEICYELFEKKSLYTAHVKKHDDKRFNCNVCDKLFTVRYRYEEHMKNHFTTEKAFPCSFCHKSYTNQSNMERHVRSVHNQERNFQCAQCGASFSRSDILKMHMAKHTDRRTIECAVCEKAFKTNQSLHYHMRIHQNRQGRLKKPTQIKTKTKPKSKTKIYRCDHCDKISHHQTTHVNHMRIHTGEKPFKCSTCKKAFRTSHARSNHQLLHTDKRPYPCKECGMAFRQISHLKSHMLTHTGDKNHVCEVCHKAFAMRSNLVAHLRIHTGEMAYACDQCPKKFLLSSQFKRHKQTHASVIPGDGPRMESCQENESESHDPQTGFCIYEIIEKTPDYESIIVQ